MGQVICNDGTTDIDNGFIAPCTFNGGVKGGVPSSDSTQTHATGDLGPLPSDDPAAAKVVGQDNTIKYTTTQKWLAVIGLTAVCYYILYKAGSLK